MSSGASFLDNSGDKDSEIFFIDQLAVFAWLRSVWPRLVWSRLRGRPRVLRTYFIDASWLAIAVAKVLGGLIGMGVERLIFRLADVRDDAGTLVQLRIVYEDTVRIQKQIVDSQVFQDLERQGLLKDRMRLFLAKAATSGGWTPGNRDLLCHALFVIRVCEWQAQKERPSGGVPVLFLERIPWLDVVRGYASERGVRLIPVRQTLRVRKSLRRLLSPRLTFFLRSFRYRQLSPGGWRLFRGTTSSNDGRQASSTSDSKIGPLTAVETIGQLNLDKPELHSELFFWQQSPLQGRDVLTTFAIPAGPLNQERAAELSKHGIESVVLHPGATTIPGMPVFKPHRWGDQQPNLNFKVADCAIEKRWVKEQLSEYHRIKTYWEDLFARHNVKAFITQDKYNAVHCAISDALKTCGGISAVYQRSYESHPAVENAIGADIVFGFAPHTAEIERLSGSQVQYHVTTGYPGDHRFPLINEISQSVRKRLKQNGAKHILAFLDENSSDDDRWHTGHRNMQENYLFLLNKVLAEPWLGLVIKPKVTSSIRRRLGPVAEVLRQAEETGRCFVFENAGLRGAYPPTAASLAADITVHSHLYGATAGLESALAGVPTVLFDKDGWSDSPLNQLGIGKVVFNTWDELWDACLQQFSSQPGIPGFGDWSPMLDELDSFRDGRAAKRMGTYIHWLLEGFRNGQDREDIMAEAAQRYCDQWGSDKISAVHWEPRSDSPAKSLSEAAAPYIRGA